jgi:hypothetical protein
LRVRLIAAMANLSNKLALIVIDFVDNTLLPILDAKVPEIARVLDQWAELRKIVNEGSGGAEVLKVEKPSLYASLAAPI